MELTRQYINEKRRVIQTQVDNLLGALEMLKVIEEETLPPETMTLDDLKTMTGASSVEVIPVEGGNNGTA